VIEALLPWVADALALVGLSVLTLSVVGILRLPDVMTRIHAAGKAGLMGAVPILVAAMLGSDTDAVPKAVLVGAFLILTTPIVAHEIGQAAFQEQRRGSITPEDACDAAASES
jgi:multicomponent Na+:H+ antiporter subunit G